MQFRASSMGQRGDYQRMWKKPGTFTTKALSRRSCKGALDILANLQISPIELLLITTELQARKLQVVAVQSDGVKGLMSQ
jgi:hypothetical protein